MNKDANAILKFYFNEWPHLKRVEYLFLIIENVFPRFKRQKFMISIGLSYIIYLQDGY